MKKTRAWCPQCYYEWHEQQEPLYEPLIWALEIVTICPKHHIPLLQACHICRSLIPWLRRRTSVPLCPACGVFLGEKHASLLVKDEAVHWQQWMFKNIETLLGCKDILSSPSRIQLTQNIRRFCNISKHQKIAVLATKLQIPEYQLRAWVSGEHIPTLRHSLQLCATFGVRLIDFLISNNSTEMHEIQGDSAIVQQFVEVKRIRTTDKARIQSLLEAELLSLEKPRPLTRLARQVGVPSKKMYRHFPHLCRTISARYRTFCIAQAEKERHMVKEWIAQETQHLINIGLFPSARLILKGIGFPQYVQFDTFFSLAKMMITEVNPIGPGTS